MRCTFDISSGEYYEWDELIGLVFMIRSNLEILSDIRSDGLLAIL